MAGPMIVPIALGVGAYAVMTQPHARRHELTVTTSGSSTEPCAETTLSAEEMYDRLRRGAEYAGLNDARSGFAWLTDRYLARVGEVEKLTASMAAGWVGDAADAAERYTRPATAAFRDSGDALAACVGPDGPLARQLDAYAKVRQEVRRLPPTPPESGVFNTLNPFETDTDRAIAEYNDIAAGNIAAYASYYASSGDNGYALPQQFPAPASTAVPSVAVRPAYGTVDGAGYEAPPPVSAGGPGTDPERTPAAGGGAPAVGGAPWSPAPVGEQATATAQSGAPGPGAPAPATPAPAVHPVSGGPGAAAGPLGSVYSRPGAGPGRPGAGPGTPRGPGGAAEPRVRGVPAAAPTTVPTTVPTSAPERAGAAGVGPGAGGRRKDADEDEERRTKYLEDEDLATQFGPTGPVAPPVIGDHR
jgi:hypothetical protein